MYLAVTDLIPTRKNAIMNRLNDITYVVATMATKEAGYSIKSIQTGVPPPKQTLGGKNIQKISGNKVCHSVKKLVTNQHYQATRREQKYLVNTS